MAHSHLTLFFTLLLAGTLLAQKQANIWHFGQRAGLSFTSGTPDLVNDGLINAFQGCATYCDEVGNLLFYTNGGGNDVSNTLGFQEGIIWNRNHEVLYNMSDVEGGGYRSAQSSIFLPKPNAEDVFYLFTMAQLFSETPSQPMGRGLSYFEIDGSMNGGLGAVTLADQRIHTPAFESLAATQHGNGNDYWLVTIDFNIEDFVVVLVNSDGVNSPIFQDSEGGINQDIASSTIKISPNGKLLFTDWELYGFDNLTGSITFLEALPLASTFSFAFSPSGRYLYTQGGGLFSPLLRYDLEAANISGSQELIDPLLGNLLVGLMQLAPDGNIYFLEQTDVQATNKMTSLGVIRCSEADIPILERDLFLFPSDEVGTDVFLGLPNFADHIFVEGAPKAKLAGGVDTLFLCPDDTTILDASVPNAIYQWSTGANTPTISVSDFEIFSVTVTDACGAVSVDSIWIKDATLEVSLDTLNASFCENETLLLEAQTVGSFYEWESGEMTNMLSVDTSGVFTVHVKEGCTTTSETFEVRQIDLPDLEIESFLGIEICKQDTFELLAKTQSVDSYLWSTGDTTISITVNEPGLYAVTASNECGVSAAEMEIIAGLDCCQFLGMPNAFSPDFDELNDVFAPVFNEDCDFPDFINYHFRIYSRWGDLLFETTDFSTGWNGTLQGKPLASDVYIWTVQYLFVKAGAKEVLELGDVTLLR